MEQLRGIHYITDRGAQQLAADIEFFSNVLSALSMPTPTFLATFRTCLSTPRDQLPNLLKSNGGKRPQDDAGEKTDEDDGNKLDVPTAHLVCKIRRIPSD